MAKRSTTVNTPKAPSQGIRKMLTIGDSLSNVIIGLGGDKDKLANTNFILNEMDQAQANMAYRGDWVARKIVDIPASDATREWRSWQADADDITKLEEAEKLLGIQRKTRNALIKARLHGGAVMFLGVDDGQTPDKPLNLNRVKQGSLKFVHTLSRWAINTSDLERDPLSPFYGEPKFYTTQSSTTGGITNIHPSRVVRFLGLERPDAEQVAANDAWGDSVLQVVSDAVRSTGLVSTSVAQLVAEAKIDVIKVPDLSENLTAQGYDNLLQQRFANANILKSVFGFLVLDSEEEYHQQASQFTGLPDIMKMFLTMVCGAADIPATRFMAQSPQGMSATGDSDTRNYYDRLASDQNMDIAPALTRLDEVLIRSALGVRPPELFYNWNSLWQMDDSQAAEIAVKRANVFKIDVDSGLLDTVVLKKAREAQLIESGIYPGLEAIIEEFDGQGEEANNEEPEIDPETGAPSDPDGTAGRIRGAVAKGPQAKGADPKTAKTGAQDFNPYHEPSGRPTGGRFTSEKYGDAPSHDDEKAYNEYLKATLDGRELSEDEANSFAYYSDTGFSTINEQLREGRTRQERREGINPHIDHLDEVLNEVAIPKNTITYRAFSNRTGDMLKNAKNGDLLVDEGYTSVSTSEQSVKNFIKSDRAGSANVIQVHLPKGSKALPISHISTRSNENEILIARNSVYSVHTAQDGSKYLRLERTM